MSIMCAISGSAIICASLLLSLATYATAGPLADGPPGLCPDCVCGVRGARSTRIVGGSETAENEFPWLAGLVRSGKVYCGASLLSTRHLLTAAHCVDGFDLREIKVLIGAHNLTSKDGIKFGLKNAWVHKDFNIFTFNNDIAIVELQNPVEFGPRIGSVCLPETGYGDYEGVLGVVAGWGRLDEREPLADTLRSISVPVWSRQQCLDAGYGKKRISENMICAGYHDGGKDACQGDSGGPMHMTGPTGSVEIIGVVSWGRGCARPNLPGIYTKITNYLPWIEARLNGECTCPRKLNPKS